jgi:hypothetical protein
MRQASTKEMNMNRIFKTAILSTAIAAMTLAALPAANARDWRRHGGYGGYGGYHHSHRGDAVAAGVVGLAAGALIAGALSNPRPAYADDGYYEEPRAAYRGGYTVEPWTREWVRYCSDRYRSFNARSGTFTGYDGQQHFCNAD